MVTSFLTYLLQTSVCIFAFWVLYKFFLSQLTYFKWMRWFIISGLLLSLVLPLYPVLIPADAMQPASLLNFTYNPTDLEVPGFSTTPHEPSASFNSLIPLLLLGVYGTGVIVRLWLLGAALFKINRLINTGQHQKDGNVQIIYISSGSPAFSFFKYVFLNKNNKLSDEELEQIKEHEKIHVRQKHTYDILLIELMGVFLWFNPVLRFVKSDLKEVHEYLVDEQIADNKEKRENYIQLLIKLASEAKHTPLVIAFSGKQLFKRISMLSKARSLAVHKFRFFIAFPMVGIMILSSSFLATDPDTNSESLKGEEETADTGELQDDGFQVPMKIGKIEWRGNTAFSEEILNEELGFQKGDVYDKALLEARLNYNPNGPDISSIYMDKGYLFFGVEVEEKIDAGSVNLTLNVYEGKKVTVGDISIEGNESISDQEILDRIPLKSKDLFNRSKLIASQKIIAELGVFDAKNILINPIPDATAQAGKEGGMVDIKFTVTELN